MDVLHNSTTACISCHDSDLPIAHLDDCNVCHNNDAIDIPPATSDCNSCHVNQSVGYHSSMDDLHNSTTDCTSCHDSNLPVAHLDNCSVCHNNNAIDINISTADCNSCHVEQDIGYHSTIDVAHTTTVCASCHGISGEVDLPTAHNDNCIVCHNSPAITLPTSAYCGNCHSSQTPDTGHHKNMILHVFESPAECAGCHDMDVTQTHSSSDTWNCYMCHNFTNSGPNAFADFANAASVEGTNCFVCHDNANITTLPTDKNCSSCHGSQLTTQHVNESTKHTSSTLTDDCIVCHSTNYLPTLHEDYGYNCTTCHNADPSRIDWNTATSSCDSCHTGHGDLGVLHTTIASPGCIRCHGTVLEIHTICSTCHGNPVIPTLPATPECKNCHGANAPLPAHSLRGDSYFQTEVVDTNDIIRDENIRDKHSKAKRT